MTSETDAPAPYAGPDYGMGEDNAHAHEIAQRDWRDAPRTHNTERMGWRGTMTPPTVAALSPEMAAPIRQQLAGMGPEQRAQREPELVMAAVRAASEDARILLGVGQFATPMQKAQVNIAYREREFERRIAAWEERLGEKTGARVVTDPATGAAVIDPATGEPKMDPIYRLTGDARTSGHAELMELCRQLAVLQGPESERELEQALRETIKLEKERDQQRADLEEVERVAQNMVREDDINRRAALRAKSLRNTIG
jgi:hypothetical protein